MAEEVKMGTQFVREIAANFRSAAPDCKYGEIKTKLVALANEMEPLAGKLYFKTQKGTEEMQSLAAKLAGLGNKLAATDQAGAESLCGPAFKEIERILEHVKTMKVRMT